MKKNDNLVKMQIVLNFTASEGLMVKIAICGKACSGKTSVANAIVYHLRDPYVSIVKLADPIYAAIKALHQPKHRGFMQEFGDLAKKHFGQEIFAQIMVERVLEIERQHPGLKVILCDDMRYPFEMEALQKIGFATVYVQSGFFVRQRRAEMLGIPLNSDHSSETSIDLIKDRCDYTLNGEVGIKTLEADAMALYDHIARLRFAA